MIPLKNKKTLICSLISVLLGLIILTFIFINKTPTNVLNDKISLNDIPRGGSSYSASASYRYYENYEQADKRTDTIVIGDVIKVNEPEKLVLGESTNTITGEKVPMSYIYTVSEVKVSKTIKGKYSAGDIIKIKQYGGTHNGQGNSMEGITYFQTGERHIFFLESYEDSPCNPINPHQGDMLIKNGKIIASNKVQFIKDNASEDSVVKALKERIEAFKVENNSDTK